MDASDVVKRWRVPGQDVIGRDSDRLFLRTLNNTLAEVDISRLPPRIRRAGIVWPLQVLRLDRKRWLISAHDRSTRPVRIPLFVTSNPLSRGRDVAPRWTGRGIFHASVVDGTVYGHDCDADPQVLLRWEKDRWTSVSGVPAAKARRGERTFGAARTGSGHEVLIWDGDGYEHVDGRLRRTFALRAAAGPEWSAVPAGGDGFYYTSKRVLMLAQRGKKPRPVRPSVKKVMQIAAGPDGAVLMKFGDNAKRWQVGVLRDGKLSGYTSQVFGTQRDVITRVDWSEGAQCVVLLACDAGLLAVPPARLGLPDGPECVAPAARSAPVSESRRGDTAS